MFCGASGQKKNVFFFNDRGPIVAPWWLPEIKLHSKNTHLTESPDYCNATLQPPSNIIKRGGKNVGFNQVALVIYKLDWKSS